MKALASVGAASGHDTQIAQVEAKLIEHDARFDRHDGKILQLEHKLEAQVAKARFEVVVWTVGALGVLAALLRLFP